MKIKDIRGSFINGKHGWRLFSISLLLLLAGISGIILYVNFSDSLLQILKWLRNIVGKNYNYEVQEYYLRKFLWLSSTGIFSGLWGILLCRLISPDDWKNRDKLWKWLLVTAVVFGIFFRIYSWSVHFLWNDTLLLADSVKKISYLQLFGPLGNCQTAPVLFLLISKFLGDSFGYTSYVLGFFPLLMSLGSLWLFYRICFRIFTVPSTLFLAISLFAMNPSLCFYSGEFKQYIGDVFCTLLVLDQVQLALLRNAKYKTLSDREHVRIYYRENWKLLFSGLLALLLSQASVYIVSASGVVLFYDWNSHMYGFKRGCFSLFPLLACWVLVVLGSIAHTLFFLPSIMHRYHSPFFAPLPFFPSAWTWYISFFGHAVKYPYGLSLSVFYLWVIILSLCIIGCIHLIRYMKQWAASILLPLLLVYAASILKQYPMTAMNNVIDSRLILFTVPLIIILFSAGINLFWCRNKKIYWILFVFAWVSAFSVCISATPFYVKIKPLVQIMQNTQKDHVMIYTNLAGRIAMELMGSFSKEQIQCENLEHKK